MGPRLPLELVDLVIAELHDNRPGLLSCALVCRDWVPFARGNLPICIRRPGEFIQIALAPTATLMSAVLRMVIGLNAYLEHEEIFILPVLSMLPKFSALRSLKLVDLKITELPSQPTLTQLILTNSKFTTYSGFIRSMTGLGNLRNLELWGTTWGRALPGQPSTVPPIILDSLHLCIFDEPPEDELIPFNVRKLGLDYTIPTALISRHLRHLGGSLRELCITLAGR